MNSYNYVFLVYVGRSGSTFFAKKLSESSRDLLIFPETKLFENVSAIKESDFNSLESFKKIDLVKQDPRWTNLNIPSEDIAKICEARFTRKQFLDAFINHIAATHDLQPKTIVIKTGSSIWHVKSIKNILPNLSLLHVRRDPRGCVSSRMKKITIYKKQGGKRLEDPWFLADFWKKYMEKIEYHKSAGTPVIEVVYEDLIRDEETILNTALESLDIERNATTENTFTLSYTEADLKHKNVNQPAIIDRLEAWKTELGDKNGVIVEHICASFISDKYFSKNITTLNRYVTIALGYTKHLSIILLRIKEKFAGLK